MELKRLCGRPLVHGIWGWIAGWIYDVWLDPAAERVVAFEICEPDRMQFVCVEPFAVYRSARYGLGIHLDSETWSELDWEPRWTSVRNIEDVTVVSHDGDWSCGVADAECDPETWRLVSLRLKRRWWQILARRTVLARRVVASGADVLIVEVGTRAA